MIHTLAHIVNAVNFVQNYDDSQKEINWAQDKEYVRHSYECNTPQPFVINYFQHLAQTVFRLVFLTPCGFSGWVMLSCLAAIWASSTRQMREYSYNSFLGIHHLFMLLFAMMLYHPVR